MVILRRKGLSMAHKNLCEYGYELINDLMDRQKPYEQKMKAVETLGEIGKLIDAHNDEIIDRGNEAPFIQYRFEDFLPREAHNILQSTWDEDYFPPSVVGATAGIMKLMADVDGTELGKAIIKKI